MPPNNFLGNWVKFRIKGAPTLCPTLRCCDIKGFKETSVSYSSAHPKLLANISKQTLDKFWWRPKYRETNMWQGTTPTNYRDTVGADNDYFLRSKTAKEHTGSTGLNPKSILFSPLPRLRTPVLQIPFSMTESLPQRTQPTQPQPGQQPQLQPEQQPQLQPEQQPQLQPGQNHNCNQNNNFQDISHNNSYQSNNSNLYISIVTTSRWEMYTSNLIKVKIRVR